MVTPSEGGTQGAWPERSEAEDEEQERDSEECSAMEEQEKVVQMIVGQPAAGWTKAESLIGSGSKKAQVPLSENTKAVRARQGRAEKAAKAASEGLLFSLPMAMFPGVSLPLAAPLSQRFHPSVSLRTSTNHLRVVTKKKIFQRTSLSLECGLEGIGQTCRVTAVIP